ncbi:addiction module protein [Aliidiomarina sedimenti]|uniref:Addiction module protein n=1 Tax=Aliidiomarina sedimenti TaxID=1933879 RepID=A0ABY0C249_9GAMM|nr:addiction module protein [Aliidiomarina sedimenti]
MNIDIKELPITERVRLVEDLWDSIASDQGSLPLTHEQRDELDKRLSSYATDGDTGRPAAETIEDIRSRL